MKLHHTALAVKNIKKSQKFFEEVFEMKEVSSGSRSELKAAFLNLEDKNGNRIELFEHQEPNELHEDLMDFSQVGFKHIAFSVEDLEAVIEKALRFGASIIWDIKPGVTVKRIAFIADPNGLPIELLEPLP